jgi:hypothetical protein
MRKTIHVVLGVLALGIAADIAQAAPKTFVNPKIGSNRLDWCLNWGSGCGEPAATAWCKTKGYNKSIDSEEDQNIGDSSPTRLLSTGAVCDQPYCDGFTFITCASSLAPPPPLPPPPLPPASAKQIFFKPKYNGVRLDWCYDEGEGCGKQAADAWCDEQGFDEAIKFKIASGVGPLKPTIYIGSGETTLKPLANAFRSITCVK